MGSKSPSTVTTTTSPPASVLSNYNDVTARAANVASTPYQAYGGELVAGINQGQSNAIGQLQSAYGTANPYINQGSDYLNQANAGLGGVQNYLQAGSQAAAQGQQYAGLAAGNAGPNAYQQYMNPYTQSVINSTMANAQNQDAQQAQQLSSNAIGQGAYGGDRAGIAQAALAGQQALANNSTIAGLESSGYTNAQQSALQNAGLYGNLANSANQSAGVYNTLGQLQGQTAQGYSGLAGQSANLGNIAQSNLISGASAGLQGSTLQQQNAQQQDTAAYGQYQAALQYPYQQTSYLANIDEGIGNSSGSLTNSPGPSALSQGLGAATTGLGILGAIGGSGGVSAGFNSVTSGLGSLFSDRRLKEDVRPIGKTFAGQTIYSFRYKGDPSGTVHTGFLAHEVEKTDPDAVRTHASGFKVVDYGEATDRAAERGHFARGGAPDGRPDLLDRFVPGTGLVTPPPQPGLDGGNQGMMRTSPFANVGYHGGEARSAAGLTKGDNPTEAAIAHDARAARLRGEYADGGSVAQVLATARGYRGGFDVGGAAGIGTIDPGQGLLTTSDTPSGLNFAAPASWGGSSLTGSSPAPGLAPGRLGAGGAGSASNPIVSTPPTSSTSSPMASLGLAGGSGAAPSDGSGGGLFGNPNVSQALMSAGLGMMAGTSPFAMANIGAGGLEGLKTYQALQQQDRQNALSQGELAMRQGALDLDRAKTNVALQQQVMLVNAHRAAAGLSPLDTSSLGLGGLAASSSAPGATQSQGLVGVGPAATASAPIASAPTEASAGAGASASASAASASAPAAGAGSGTAFWSTVDPDNNPFVLNARANAAMGYGDADNAEKLRTQAQNITKNGVVMLRDGTMANIPGYGTTVSTQKAAETAGTEAGAAHTIYDQDGNPTLVDGSTYQQVAKTGSLNGQPVSAVQSPYNVADVDNYKDFSKNAIDFNKGYQPNLYALNSLNSIYANYQGGRGAEAIAELDSYAKQAGIEGALPKNWQNSTAGFDAALKTATGEGFQQLQQSGITRAPATGLREVMLTVPRPDADPAARQKAITDAIANLNYQHDLIGSVAASGDRNVLRAQTKFINATPFTGYVDNARAGGQMPAGTNQGQLKAVMGGTPASIGSQAQPQPQPAQAQTARPAAVPALPASVPPGSAYSPSRKMWRSPSGALFDAQGRPA